MFEVLSGTAAFFAVFAVLLPLHELGHALAALLVGFRVWEIVLGVGGPLFSFRVGRISVRVNKFPLAGLTRALPVGDQRLLRLRLWLVTAGGPAANLAIHLLLARLPAGAPQEVVEAVRSANLTALVLNLIPFRTADGQASDGYQLLTVPFWSKNRRARHLIDVSIAKAIAALERGDEPGTRALLEEGRQKHGPQAGLDLIEGSLLHRARRHPEARAVWREALARADNPQQAAVLKNNIAFVGAILGGPDDLREAEQLSGEAAAVLHDIPPINGTRGAVLARLGRAREAITCLELGAHGVHAPWEQAYAGCFLALAQAQAGRFLDAHATLTRARGADPDCELLPEVAAVIEAGTAAPERADANLEAAPGQVAIEGARAVRRWRIAAVALAFTVSIVLGASGRLTMTDVFPMVLAMVITIFPERTGLWALGAALGTMAFQHLAGFDLLRTDQREAPWLPPALLAGTAAAFWLAWRSPPPTSTRTPRVIRILLALCFGLLAAMLLFSLSTGMRRSYLSGSSAIFVAFAVALLLSRRRWVKALVVLPAAALALLVLRGNPWSRPPLDAHLPPPGAPLAAGPLSPTVVGTHTAVLPGRRPMLSPSGKAYLIDYLGEVSFTDPTRSPWQVRVGELGGRAFDVAGHDSVFIDDQRLVVTRATGLEPVNELVEIQPGAGPTPIWKKALPPIQVKHLAVDAVSREVFILGQGDGDQTLVLRTAPTRDAPVEKIVFPASKPGVDRMLAPYRTPDAGLGLLVARVPSRFEPGLPAHEGYVQHADLEDDDSASIEVWALTRDGERRLSEGVANLSCPWVNPLGSAVSCWTSQLAKSWLVTIDPASGKIERRGSPQESVQVSILSDGRLVWLTPHALTVFDLGAGRASVLALPESPKGTRRWLASGALATVSRSGGQEAPATITVYQAP